MTQMLGDTCHGIFNSGTCLNGLKETRKARSLNRQSPGDNRKGHLPNKSQARYKSCVMNRLLERVSRTFCLYNQMKGN
jgi:hypothetical protein